jgi:hydroxymethylbilane synthase
LRLLVGSRGSRLSLIQTNTVLSLLKSKDNSLEFDIITIKTRGDTDARPLYTIDGKGVFEKEVDLAVLNGHVHFAVHSMKDVPSDLHDDLTIACVPKRDSPYDVLLSNGNLRLDEFKRGSIIGTSSLRRLVQLRMLRDDLVIKPIRGNVETRIDKMLRGDVDGLVLAEAGLARLGLSHMIAERLTIDKMLPAIGQGALAVVTRRDSHDIIHMLKSIEDRVSRAEVDAERALLKHINAGCRMPIGALALSSNDRLELHAGIFSYSSNNAIRVSLSAGISDAERLGTKAAEYLIERGALKLAEEWRSMII